MNALKVWIVRRWFRMSWVIGLALCLSGGISEAVEKPTFDADKAWDYLTAQCDFGPRNPGSKAHDACRDYLKNELLKRTDRVSLQYFTHTDKRLRTTFHMHNIIADFGDVKGPKIILCAHWDCRPRADRDPRPSNHKKPILGANDGASGVAVLLEMARLFKRHPPPQPVQIILFDGEDYGREGEIWDYLLGSRYFAQNADPSDYSYAILLDMIGDASLEIKREYNSYIHCGDLQDWVWKTAQRIGVQQFSDRMTIPIIDDHMSLIEVGIEAIDIIDFEYPFWHTLEDTPNKCSKKSLEAVGRVLVELIYGEPRR